MTVAPLKGDSRPRPVVLCILDGWGRPTGLPDDAISAGRTPTFDQMMSNCATANLQTSGAEVGLPEGQMGNSEVGHMNLGGGRVVLQDLPRIDEAVRAGDIGRNPALCQMIDALKQSGGSCHLLGLLSPGGVHSHQNHIATLAREIADAGISVHIHAFLDGRDTPPQSALEYLKDLEAQLAKDEGTVIATVCGRYYAMDRDQRWERVAQSYNAIVNSDGASAPDAKTTIKTAYASGITDEFVEPTVLGGYQGIRDGDGVLMANFRTDRAREILAALLDPAFDGFERPREIALSAACGMVEYSTALQPLMTAMFPAQPVDNSIGEVIARAGLRQLRIAETEKYAHVTFFFNGGSEAVFPGEDRMLIPSPKVATYDLQPEMSAVEVTERLVEAVGSGSYDFIVVNYANPDMVGHTGDFAAAVRAVETVDDCLAELQRAVAQAGGVLFVTADHGNIEHMKDEASGQPFTAHTTNSVPAILAVVPNTGPALEMADGRLADVAPTLLQFLDIPLPENMTGRSLIEPVEGRIDAGQSMMEAGTGQESN
jgi:2,3-bisphosphoglycerate-independent phosphoglycerate mutase